MSKKIFATIAVVLMIISVFSTQVFAMAETSAEIPFVVKNFNSTVVIQTTDDDAPMPDITAYSHATEGVFKITYSEPETYHYRVFQIEGADNAVIYDKTVYNVIVSVLTNDDGELYTVVTISVDDSNEKRDSVIFENKTEDEDITGTPPETGDNNKIILWSSIVCLSAAGIIIVILAKRRNHTDEDIEHNM